MNFLANLLLGKGTLKPELRAELESEGLVLLEEGLSGSVRYKKFRASGRYFNGKITPERFGLGISEKRFVVYCRSGRAELIDSPFSEPRLAKLDIDVEHDGALAIVIDYDQLGEPKVSGEIRIRAKTPHAATIVEELNARIAR